MANTKNIAELKEGQEAPPRSMTIRDMLARHKDQISAALPAHLTVDRMARLATTAIRRNPRLQEADAISLFGAIITCAQYGLEPGITGHLVPFRNNKTNSTEVQCIPDYRGLMDIARRSGTVTKISARVARQGDHFQYAYGTNEHIEHQPHGDGTAPVTHAYAVALVDGEPQIEVMTREQIDRVRARSRAADSGPWAHEDDFAEMARKTVVKRLCKYLPMSIEFRDLARLDDYAEAGKSQQMGAIITGEIVPEEEQ